MKPSGSAAVSYTHLDVYKRQYVISNDIVDMSRNGIVHYNMIDFLLNKKSV